MIPPERRTATRCIVYTHVPGLDKTGRDRFERALHEADRKLGVSVGGPGRFILLTSERTETAARDYTHRVMRQAAAAAGIAQNRLEGIAITEIEAHERTLTGRPQRVTATPGVFRTLKVGERRQLHALHEGPLGEWIVYLNSATDDAWMGRGLLAVLAEVFELPFGGEQFNEIIQTLAGYQTPLGVRYACPCCDFLTLTEPPPGTFAICPVCRWEDDAVQFCDPEYPGGANRPSLLEARETYRRIGASQTRRLERARPPLRDERP